MERFCKPVPANGTAIPARWARERIRGIEEGKTGAEGSRQLHRKENLAAKAAIALSMKHGLLCRETTYIATETRPDAEKPTGEIILRKVLVMLTKGWGELTPYSAKTFNVQQSSSRYTGANSAHLELPYDQMRRISSAISRTILHPRLDKLAYEATT